MEKSINYYKEQFKKLIEDMCRDFGVTKAQVHIGCMKDNFYKDSIKASCDIDFDD